MTNEQQRTPDETPIYYQSLSEERIAGAFTEENIAAALAELQEQGHVRTEAVYPGYGSAYIPTERPVRHVASDPPTWSIMRVGLTDRLLTAIDRLGEATVAYGAALDAHAAAVIDAYESQATLDYAELDFRAQLLAVGVPGSNEPTRKINLDLAVMDDEALSELRIDADKCRHARTQTEATERKLDVQQKSLRAQIGALQALLNH